MKYVACSYPMRISYTVQKYTTVFVQKATCGTYMVSVEQISALDRVQKKAAKFAHHKNSPNWETLASRRKLTRICALFKAYSGERAWKPIGDRLQQPHYLSRIDHEIKIRSRR